MIAPPVASPADGLCGALLTSDSLNETVQLVYWSLWATPPGLAPVRTPWGEVHGLAAYPNESVEQRRIAGAWTQVCGGPEFAAIVREFGVPNVSESPVLNTTTGDYVLEISADWVTSCPDGWPASSCQLSVEWWLDMVTAHVTVSVAISPASIPDYSGPQPTVTLGGASPAYPYFEQAAQWFEQIETSIAVSVDQGSESEGLVAVCHGSVDAAFTTTPVNASELSADYGCSSGYGVWTTAYEAVAPAVEAANPHGLQSLSSDTLLAIYDGSSSGSARLLASSIDGVPFAAGTLDRPPWNDHGPLAWDQVPACAAGAAACGGVGAPDEQSVGSIGAGRSCANGVDICAVEGASPCGFTVCAGGVNATDLIATVAPRASSASTAAFEARLLGATGPNTTAASASQLGTVGCGENDVLSDCGIRATTAASDSAAVNIADDPDALGYVAIATGDASPTGVHLIPFDAVGQTNVTGPGTFDGAVAPSLGPNGTIAAGIFESGVAAPYQGWVPMEFITNESWGWVGAFLGFLMDPEINVQVAAAAGALSIESV